MEWVSGNVFIRPMPHRLDAVGACVQGHAHPFDHTSIVLLGAARFEWIKPDGQIVVLDRYAADDEFRDSRCHVLIKAGAVHKITALALNTIVWCVYSHRTPQGEVCQVRTGWDDGYSAMQYPTDAMVEAGVEVLRREKQALLTGKREPLKSAARHLFETMLQKSLA